MNAPQLAAQVVDRVRGFDFGAKEGIGPVTILYPIDFLPAADSVGMAAVARLCHTSRGERGTAAFLV